jgi:hypothetical protein
MLECWKNGKMGFGILAERFDVKTCLNKKIKKMDQILLQTNIPTFHYSIIPSPDAIPNSYILCFLVKRWMSFIDCKLSFGLRKNHAPTTIMRRTFQALFLLVPF